jgi:hypothetical protein
VKDGEGCEKVKDGMGVDRGCALAGEKQQRCVSSVSNVSLVCL